MNTNDLLAKWSTLSLDQIEAQLASGTDAQATERLFGIEQVAALQGAVPGVAAAGPREAVVLLPGIMGSLLTSIRGITELLWINPVVFLEGRGNYLELNRDGTGDAYAIVDIVPSAIERLVYLKISLTLHRQTDLYEFPYDWRRPIEWNADVLDRCIERWADDDPNRRFTLVGHSMGGIVARAYLARHKGAAEKRIKRVITLGTPYFGAAGAIENIVNGNQMMAIAAKLNPNNVPERLLLSMPSVFELLPAPRDLFPSTRDYPANWELYEAAEWRREAIRQDYLDLAQGFHRMIAGADPQMEIVQIAGCNLETTVEVRREFGPDEKPQFEMVHNEEGPDAGDGTVPLWSAILPGAKMYYIQQRHRYLPADDHVLEGVLALIHGGTPDLPTEIPPRKAWPFGARLGVAEDLDAGVAGLRERLENGTASEQDLAMLYFAT